MLNSSARSSAWRGGVRRAYRLRLGPVDGALAGTIKEVNDQGRYRHDDEEDRKQHQGRKKLLHKIDLQGRECGQANPQPLPRFFRRYFDFLESHCLTHPFLQYCFHSVRCAARP